LQYALCVHTLLKSEVGPYPEPHFPRGIDLNAEDKKARRRLYPVTIAYSLQITVLLALSLRSGKAGTAFAMIALGILAWIPIEYCSHRYVLHRAFPKRGVVGGVLHRLFDASHADHHARPWDGMYINGHFDTLWFAVVAMPLSLLAPLHTMPVFFAAVLLSYVTEEWVHHACHFRNFRWSYFQYLRRRHLFHHSRHGRGLAYGVTSGLWDGVMGTRIPGPSRERLLPSYRERKPQPLGVALARPAADGG
jgi:sterol desaturase/sphingolipid hydroxylase (fatty acid hydroxylase superfamily)